jgi:hypothetical protein
VQLKKSVDFEFKKEKFKLFIDWENDLCLTHYSENYINKENAWLVGGLNGLKNKLKNLIEVINSEKKDELYKNCNY